MSEPNSLYISIGISREKLQQFFTAKPLSLYPDDNWNTWWNSREMYSKSELEAIQVYTNETNRGVFDDLLNDTYTGAAEYYDEASQSWTFIAPYFSENYFEIIPMLSLMKNFSAYLDKNATGVAIIYDFFWGDESVMAYLEFSDQQAMLNEVTVVGEIAADVFTGANDMLEKRSEELREMYED